MIIVRLWGGIGNQLFQYSFGEFLRLTKLQEVRYDISSFGFSDKLREFELQILNENIKIADDIPYSKSRGLLKMIYRFCFSIKPKNHFVKENMYIDKNFINQDTYYFEGYWQNECYINYLRSQNELFAFPVKEIPNEISHYLFDIQNSNSIALHIRRGDYFTAKNITTYGVCDENYYYRALDYLHDYFPESKIFVFSDDLNWVQTHLKLPLNTVFVDNYDINQYWYIYLMSLCKHNIISNSTFSWWGAYLNQNPQKMVLSPKRWTLKVDATLALSTWIKI